MKLGQVVSSISALNNLASEKMKAKQAYRVSRVLMEANGHLDSFNSARDKAIEKYGEKNDDGNIAVDQKSKGFKKFTDELNALFDEEIEMKFNKIKLKEIGNLEVSVADMVALDWLIDD
jgi:hypothetical protein